MVSTHYSTAGAQFPDEISPSAHQHRLPSAFLLSTACLLRHTEVTDVLYTIAYVMLIFGDVRC